MNPRPHFRAAFPSGQPVILVVIHVESITQTLQSAEAVVRGGADGCFLIQHDGNSQLLRRAYRKTRAAHPDLWIGLNFLGRTPADAAMLATEPHVATATRMPDGGPIPPAQGLWVDDPLAVEHFAWQSSMNMGAYPRGFLDIHAPEASVHAGGSGNLLPESLYFAGAAFKYQDAKGVSLAQECGIVARRCDVLTTSGDRTGAPPTVEKMEAVRAAVGPETPIAIASGIDARNVRSFLPTTQAFLVASSITGADQVTDERLLRALVEAAKS